MYFNYNHTWASLMSGKPRSKNPETSYLHFKKVRQHCSHNFSATLLHDITTLKGNDNPPIEGLSWLSAKYSIKYHRTTAHWFLDWGRGVGLGKDGSHIVFPMRQKAAQQLTYNNHVNIRLKSRKRYFVELEQWEWLSPSFWILGYIPGFVALRNHHHCHPIPPHTPVLTVSAVGLCKIPKINDKREYSNKSLFLPSTLSLYSTTCLIYYWGAWKECSISPQKRTYRICII